MISVFDAIFSTHISAQWALLSLLMWRFWKETVEWNVENIVEIKQSFNIDWTLFAFKQ